MSALLLFLNLLYFLPLTMFLGTLLLSNIRRYNLICKYGLLVRVDTTNPPLEDCPVLTTSNPDNVRMCLCRPSAMLYCYAQLTKSLPSETTAPQPTFTPSFIL